MRNMRLKMKKMRQKRNPMTTMRQKMKKTR